MNGSFCNFCTLALWLALLILATQCWRDPALSVLAMLVSRNVFHVVSTLQSIVMVQKRALKLSLGSREGEKLGDSGSRLYLPASMRWKICNYVYTQDFFVQSRSWMVDWRNIENSTTDNNREPISATDVLYLGTILGSLFLSFVFLCRKCNSDE